MLKVGLDRTEHISVRTGQYRTLKFAGHVLPNQTKSGLIFLLTGFGQVYVVGSDWNSDYVQVSSNELRLNGGGRIYFAKDSTDGVYPDMYWQVSMSKILVVLGLICTIAAILIKVDL